jgi:DNA-binding transcriptional MerR regulator
MAAWKTTGGVFCRLGGEDKELALTMESFQRPFSMARLRTGLAAGEKTRLREICKMIEAGRPIAEINKASSEFVRDFPGVEPESAVSAIAKEIKGVEAAMEELRNKRQEYQTSFENFDQKTNQLFNILSTVMKTMKETQSGIVRNIK